MSLGDAAQRLMQVRGLCALDIVRRVRGNPAATYRTLNGSTRNPLLSSIVDLATALRTDPDGLLQEAGLWPPAPQLTDDQDRALLSALVRLEALPVAQKRWALGVVQALARGAPSGATDSELPQLCGYD